jgi:septum formation protein
LRIREKGFIIMATLKYKFFSFLFPFFLERYCYGISPNIFDKNFMNLNDYIFENKTEVYLLSSSPRRKYLFKELFKNFKIIDPVIELNYNNTFKNNPDEFVKKNSLVKYFSIEKQLNKNYIAVAADTIVYLDGKIIGKPANYDNAVEILRMLSNRKHFVYTGYSIIIYNEIKRIKVNYDVSEVKFKKLNYNEIYEYLLNNKYKDKAGCYGIQHKNNELIESFNGDKKNVMGFPISKIYKDIKILIKNLTNI